MVRLFKLFEAGSIYRPGSCVLISARGRVLYLLWMVRWRVLSERRHHRVSEWCEHKMLACTGLIHGMLGLEWFL